MDIPNIYDTKEILKGTISKTSLMHADKLHKDLWIKTESLQGTGAFKLRGAYRKLHSLTQKEREKDVIAAGAGNHAQEVTYSCMGMGIKGTIVMPKTAPLSKIEAARNYGIAVEPQGDTFSDACEYAKDPQEITGAVFVESSDDEYVITRRGAIGLEILDRLSDVGTVVVPIGGGGLISGIAVAIKAMRPNCCIVGVQFEHAPSMGQSLKKKEIIKLQNVSTITDGVTIRTSGELTYELRSKYADEAVIVSEEEIAAAILTLLEKMKMIAEGVGTTSVAAAMFGEMDLEHHGCVTVLFGRSIDVNLLSKIIDLGLMKTKRKAVINMNVMDRPGSLSRMVELVSRAGVNIISVNHSHIQNVILFNQCRVGVIVEANDSKHIEDVLATLKNSGYDPYLVEHV